MEVANPTAQKSILYPNPSHLVPQPLNLPFPHPVNAPKRESKQIGQKWGKGFLGETLREMGQGGVGRGYPTAPGID